MIAKPKLVYYSDCPFFGGCENMIGNFLNDSTLNEAFEVSFIYRYTKVYEQVLNQRVPGRSSQSVGINLPDQQIVHSFFKKNITNRYFRIFISFPFILFWKYYCVICSIRPIYVALKSKGVIDILHINNGGYPAAFSCYAAVLVARFLKIKKIIYVVNNITADYNNPLRWLDYFLDKFVSHTVTFFITGSNFAKQALVNALSLKSSQVLNIPNGILMRKTTMDKTTFKHKFLIPDNRKLFTVVALLEKRKGHLSLLKAISLLKEGLLEKNNDLPIFVFEGNGAEKNNILEFIKSKNLDSDVLLIGTIDNVFNLIFASDVIILPSISDEDFPNIVIEAMMLEKPVISTRIAGIPEQIIDDHTGYIVEPDRPHELALAINRSLKQEVIDQFSKNAQKIFFEKFSVRKSIDRYIEIYERKI